ncbi:MAG: hypothetical protein DMF61_05105 [Blastocatellia bacterium AA13]|nr:MAG: hypothetical protein DMF61_05105 [Blastocatellia bacterium AA13]
MKDAADINSNAWNLRRLLVSFAGLFIINLALRVFYLRFDFVNGDEAVRALTAVQWLDGARLYVDAITDKPPGATLFYAAIISLFGRSMTAVHLAAIVWNFGAAVIVYIIGAKLFDRKTGLLAAFLFVYFGTNYFTQDTMAANTELLMALPYTASFLYFVRGVRSEGRWNFFLAGILTGAAALFKQVAVFNCLFFVIYECIHIYLGRGRDIGLYKRIINSAARLAVIAAGVILVAALFVVWLGSTGTLAGFWRNAVVLGAFYIGSLPRDLWLRFMVTRSLGYLLFNIVLWALAAVPVIRALRHRNEAEVIGEQGRLSSDLVIGLWGVCSLSGVFTSGRFYGHYFIQCLPALALLGARGIGLIAARKKRTRRLAASILGALFLFSFIRFHQRTAVLAFETLSGARTRWSKAWGMTTREDEAEIIAGEMRRRVGAGLPLYIWGYALDVYWRSGCRPASRYLTPYYFTGHFYPEVTKTEGPPGERFWREAHERFIEDLRRNRPRLILNVDEDIQALPYPDIISFINDNYEREGLLGPNPAHQFIVYRLKD